MEKIATYDPSYFIEAADELDWDKISLVVRSRYSVLFY